MAYRGLKDDMRDFLETHFQNYRATGQPPPPFSFVLYNNSTVTVEFDSNLTQQKSVTNHCDRAMRRIIITDA